MELTVGFVLLSIAEENTVMYVNIDWFGSLSKFHRKDDES